MIATAGRSRGSLLAAMAEAERDLAELAELAAGADREGRVRLGLHRTAVLDAYARAAEEYRAQLPRRALSRCPYTNAILTVAIDDAGLDGPWWRYEKPVREADENPPTLFALTGAMRLTPPVERVPFMVMPGPPSPHVIPRLLDGTQATVVISSLPIGRHTGFAIAYYATVAPETYSVGMWGRNESDAPWVWPDDPTAYDYDIARWITAGRVKWIAPGDGGLVLRDGVAGCPYLGGGGQGLQWIRNGEVRS